MADNWGDGFCDEVQKRKLEQRIVELEANNMDAAVAYGKLLKRIEELEAATDKATPVNLTHHGYFNLSGGAKRDILGHTLQINAEHFTPVDYWDLHLKLNEKDQRIEELEARLQRVGELPEKWREFSYKTTEEYTNLHGCADELQAALGDERFKNRRLFSQYRKLMGD